MKARALLIEALVGIASAAVAAGAFCWMAKYTVLKEADMIVIAAFLWLWVACNVENIKGVANLDTLATDRKQKGGWAKRLYLYRG